MVGDVALRSRPIRGIAACAGIGGLELGLKLAIGRRYTVSSYIERESSAAATLVARMEDKTLDDAPIHGAIESFPGADFSGCEVVTAGVPCQPFSSAGLNRGTEDGRWIWDDLFRNVIRPVEPNLFFLECF